MEGKPPDLLSEARHAAAIRTNARNVYVLTAGNFADFRLDAPPDVDVVFDSRDGLFCVYERGGRQYIKMGRKWYERFVRECNALPAISVPREYDADIYLCCKLLNIIQRPAPASAEHFALIRACMQLPAMIRGHVVANALTYAQIVQKLREANARALARRADRYSLRACARFIIHFLLPVVPDAEIVVDTAPKKAL